MKRITLWLRLYGRKTSVSARYWPVCSSPSKPSCPRLPTYGLNLFQHLPYAPAKAFRWIADERELAQVCGFLTIARLLQKKGDMEDRVANEFLDQAVSCFLTGSYAVRNAVSAALRRFMEHSEEHAFRACRCVDGMKDSSSESERLLYEVVSAVVE